MPDATNRPLKVFLCHASDDKPAVRELYRQLCAEGWLDVWLDEEKLLPGQEWDLEIEKAVEAADVVLVTLSTTSVDKEGYVQKELHFVLNIADQKPEGAIFIIPIRLNDCPAPRRLRMWQYVDYFPKDRRKWAYERILQSLKLRAARLGIVVTDPADEKARREAEERACKEAEDRARKDKVKQDRKAAEDLKHKQAEDGARQEKEARERKAAEQARKAAEKPQPVKKPARKINFVPFGIGAVVLLILAGGIFGINYIIKNWPATNTPSPISTQVSERDGMVMVYVPAGEFEMGSDNGNSDEQPVHTVYLDSFWIDQTEVTNKMYALCVTAGKCDPPSSSQSFTRQNYYGNPEYDNYPVITVTWNDASAYCAWAGRRLPTEAEWEKTASWDNNKREKRIYPWGNPINCTLANYWGKYSSCVGDTAEVGSYPSGASFYGALDMAGNVREWVNDWYSDTYYASSPSSNPLGPISGTSRVLRGGSWGEDDIYLHSAYRDANQPMEITGFSYYIGFRCSRGASP